MNSPKIILQRKPSDDEQAQKLVNGATIKLPTLISRTVKQTDSTGQVRSVQIETKKKRVLTVNTPRPEEAPSAVTALTEATSPPHESAGLTQDTAADASRTEPSSTPIAAPIIKAPERKKVDKPAPAAQKEKGKQDKSRQDDDTGRRHGVKKPDSREFGFSKRRHKTTASAAAHEPLIKPVLEISVPATITVGELAKKMSEKAASLIMHLFKLGQMATINQELDQETAMILVAEMGHKALEAKSENLEDWLNESALLAKNTADLAPRAPVVTVMGHVDHGKTSLLDKIRSTKVASGEAGGITQSIGAYSALTPRGPICFIDTPGHAAFTAMRERGAQATDIVILVVAADDGVMPQTREALEQARSAGAPIVVAITKIDKNGMTLDKARNGLIAEGLIPEDLGGMTPFVGVSGKTGFGLDELLERVLLQSEIMELNAAHSGNASGVVLESKIEKGRGPVATILVQSGLLEIGQTLLAGSFFGRVKAMRDCSGNNVKSAGPSVAVQVMGLSGAPAAGSQTLVCANERKARELANQRAHLEKNRSLSSARVSMIENLFGHIDRPHYQMIPLIIKADSRGSLEALTLALIGLGNDEVGAKIIFSGVGALTENDLTLAQTAHARILCFNVPCDAHLRKNAAESHIPLLRHDIIYAATDEIKDCLSALLPPECRETVVGHAEIRKIFPGKTGPIAGCLVTEGLVKKGLCARVIRQGSALAQTTVASLRRGKEDVSETRSGTECGIFLSDNPDFMEGDEIEFFEQQMIARKLP